MVIREVGSQGGTPDQPTHGDQPPRRGNAQGPHGRRPIMAAQAEAGSTRGLVQCTLESRTLVELVCHAGNLSIPQGTRRAGVVGRVAEDTDLTHPWCPHGSRAGRREIVDRLGDALFGDRFVDGCNGDQEHACENPHRPDPSHCRLPPGTRRSESSGCTNRPHRSGPYR